MKDNLGVLIVTYNPTMDVFKIINSSKCYTKATVVIDNGSRESDVLKKLREYHLENNRFYFIELEKNMGLGFAQNYGLKKLSELNIKYISNFDQDSEVESDFFKNAIEEYKTANNIFKHLGILVPIYFDKKEKKISSFTVKEGKKYKKTFINQAYQEVAFANASGMIFKLDLITEVGGMREDFFIDQIDVEFCKRVSSLGFSIVASKQLKITHTVGEGEETRIGRFSIKHSNHNTIRRYYIARNSVITRKLYKSDTAFTKLIDKRLLKTFIVCFIEKDRFSKIYSIIKGVRDGLSYKNES